MTAADLFLSFLEAEGEAVVLPPLSQGDPPADAWPASVGPPPARRGGGRRWLSVVDTGGVVQDREMRTGRVPVRPSVQVLCRAETARAALGKLEAVLGLALRVGAPRPAAPAAPVPPFTPAPGPDGPPAPTLLLCSVVSPPTPVGRDEAGDELASLNLRLTVRPPPAPP